MINTLLNICGVLAYYWLLALIYVCFILNHTGVGSLHWRTSIEKLTGSTPDISSLLCFHFWEPVYYRDNDNDFLLESTEKLGHFVDISEHVSHTHTLKLLTDDTKKIINRSRIRSALNPKERNLRVDPKPDDHPPKVLQSKHENDLQNGKVMPTLDHTDLIGREFLLPSEEYRLSIEERSLRL